MLDNQEDIIKGCANGKRQAQNDLYKYFAGKMFGVCLRYAKDATEAEDILQDGFIKVFQHIGSFKNNGSLEGWVRRIMVNTALERFRKKNTLYFVGEVFETGKHVRYDETDSHFAVDELMELVKKLPAGYKVVFNLFAIEGYSHREISEQLGISEGTSKSQLARARAVLKEEVTKLYSHGLKRQVGS